jgi:3',5'-cyclic AMP phosphodiesterase CpdA
VATVRIVHISDLHFVPGKQDAQVWEVVRDFINNRVKPHAILVTGDVTDSAKHGEFTLAKQSLGSLNVQPGGDTQKYRIVAGNHDRFLYRGNNPPVGRGWLSRRHWPRDKAARFDQAFPGAVQITPGSPCEMTLGSPHDGPAGVQWKIRIVGMDSSAESQWFAQGALSNTNIDIACQHAAEAVEHDLVIALVHHHILPIPAVEQKKLRGGGMTRLLDVTGLLNAGALMEAMSRTQVDLVLHGHEHSPHQARFTGSDELATSVALLAAGSATGDETLHGWDLKRVHFNVIELDDDRSVWLRQVDAVGGHLDFRPSRKLILTADEIRVSRFVRRNRRLSDGNRQAVRKLPNSRLRKVVEFRSNRNIELTESRTDWQVNPLWTPITSSGSGTVGPAIVEFDWDDGERSVFPVQADEAGPEPDQHTFRLLRPQAGPRLARRVTTRWTWTGAAAFTQAELDMLPPTAKQGPRKRGEEFASILCPDEFEALVLSVRLPPQFSPPPEATRVYFERPDAPGVQVYSDEIGRGLEMCGPGNFELRIAYPMPNYRYGISWPVLQRTTRSDHAETFARGLLQRQAEIETLMTRQLQARGWLNQCRWAIYLPENGDRPTRLQQAWSMTDAGPEVIVLGEARGLARAAFWGDAMFARADGSNNRHEVLPDEQLLGCFALRERRELTHQALAILRIAFKSDPVGDEDEAAWVAEFKSFANLCTILVASLALGRTGVV